MIVRLPPLVNGSIPDSLWIIPPIFVHFTIYSPEKAKSLRPGIAFGKRLGYNRPESVSVFCRRNTEAAAVGRTGPAARRSDTPFIPPGSENPQKKGEENGQSFLYGKPGKAGVSAETGYAGPVFLRRGNPENQRDRKSVV